MRCSSMLIEVARAVTEIQFPKYKCNRRKCLWTFQMLSVGNNFTKLQTMIKFGSDKKVSYAMHRNYELAEASKKFKNANTNGIWENDCETFSILQGEKFTSKGIFGVRPLALNIFLINTCFKRNWILNLTK